jgi:hypothetical protein
MTAIPEQPPELCGRVLCRIGCHGFLCDHNSNTMERIVLTTLMAVTVSLAAAQESTGRTYLSGGSEFAFSAPILDVNGSDQGAVIRFAPMVNVQQTVNKDLSDNFGLFLGLSVNNVGFIYDSPDSTNYRFKYRTYNLGLPVGFKVGTMDGGLFFAGYSVEWAFNYKEKRFLNENKEDKFVVWGSDRVIPFQQAVMAGFQLGNGSTLKVKYYFTNFHNKDYVATQDGVQYKPYDGLNANVLTVSLGFALFKRYESTF